eukprot:CAMPEP_0202101144 /NCGR_PEP_ID=MMETSP0965-20130614/3554_1 /ASSEMBLY_ACC=CAM_ASM_000507 /TAXON_ID=4773 /ORGANISM="Schizochytrium aggregatum, Strain ATCC28209" /LENGTH=45 /DNA_ID= /DNA_START= /DNA_END= /DNA_ORIENTATION=
MRRPRRSPDVLAVPAASVALPSSLVPDLAGDADLGARDTPSFAGR